MSCYDAFNEIVEDFKHLLEHRERTIVTLEEQLSENFLEESNAIRRLEQQIAMLRGELVESNPGTKLHPYTCSNCQKPLVHDQYSKDIATTLIKSRGNKIQALPQWSPKTEPYYSDKMRETHFTGLSSRPISSLSQHPNEMEVEEVSTATRTIPDSQDDLERRMVMLNERVDKVTSKTYRMLNRTSTLNSDSEMLKDQVSSLYHNLRSIDQNLK